MDRVIPAGPNRTREPDEAFPRGLPGRDNWSCNSPIATDRAGAPLGVRTRALCGRQLLAGDRRCWQTSDDIWPRIGQVACVTPRLAHTLGEIRNLGPTLNETAE